MVRTSPTSLQFPSWELIFMQKYQIFLYTKPYSIQVEIKYSGFLGDTFSLIDIDVPGEKANTLTSTAGLFRDVEFQKIKVIKPSKPKKADELKKKKKAPQEDPQQEEPQVDEQGEGLIQNNEDEGEETLVSEQTSQITNEIISKGKLQILVSWKGFGRAMPPPNASGFGVFRQVKATKQRPGMHNPSSEMDRLMLIDVNDPRNHSILDQYRKHRSQHIRRLLDRDMNFALYDTPSLRQELLYLKRNNPKIKKIPFREKQIAEDPELCSFIKENLEKEHFSMHPEIRDNKDAPILYQNIAKGVDTFPYSADAQKRIRLLRKILNERRNKAQGSNREKTVGMTALERIIDEFTMPDAKRDIFGAWSNLFAPRRKLRPSKVTKKKIEVSSKIKYANIGIHVIKGINMPARLTDISRNAIEANQYDADYLGQTIKANQSVIGTNTNLVNELQAAENNNDITENHLVNIQTKYNAPSTFVKARVIDQRGEIIYKTSTFAGIDPGWNETISMIYHAIDSDKGLTVDELINNESILYVSIFDFVGSWEENQMSNNRYNILVQNRFIGSFQIPLLTLFQNPKINSYFKINRPLTLFGYMSTKSNIFSVERSMMLKNVNPFLPSYISMSLSVEPEFHLPSRNDNTTKGHIENPTFLIIAKRWLDSYFKKTSNSNKNVQLLGEDIEGNSVFLPRFFKSLKPPDEIPMDESAYQKVARFVSMIPFKNDSQYFKDMPDIFSDCQQFIDLLAGDYEEHAILLCNYLNYIDEALGKADFESCLIFGNGVPDGHIIYILRRDKKNDDNEIWDPLTGDVYRFTQEKLTSSFFCFTCQAGTRIKSQSKLILT